MASGPIVKKLKRVFKFFVYFLLRLVCLPIKLLFPARLKTERISLPISDLPADLSGLRICHLSDFHWSVGPQTHVTPEMLEEVIRICNSFEPDLVLLTGDFVQRNPAASVDLAGRLQRLRAKCGVYAVLGNHDYKRAAAAETISEALRRNGIHVMMNQWALPFDGDSAFTVPSRRAFTRAKLQLVGLTDLHTGTLDTHIFDGLVDGPRVVLSHNPDSAALFTSKRVDLMLSGHTHGGQICIPGHGPLIPFIARLLDALPFSRSLKSILPAKVLRPLYSVVRHWEWASGLSSISRDDGGVNFVYTSRGLATHPPLRLFCDPEVTLITLTRPPG